MRKWRLCFRTWKQRWTDGKMDLDHWMHEPKRWGDVVKTVALEVGNPPKLQGSDGGGRGNGCNCEALSRWCPVSSSIGITVSWYTFIGIWSGLACLSSFLFQFGCWENVGKCKENPYSIKESDKTNLPLNLSGRKTLVFCFVLWVVGRC